MYRLSVYVPADSVEKVKTAMFDAGAGRIGDYEHCAWQVLGSGQFRPLSGARPAIGEVGTEETVQEYQVEMVCADEHIAAVIAALCAAHPYEEPAYQYWQVNPAL